MANWPVSVQAAKRMLGCMFAPWCPTCEWRMLLPSIRARRSRGRVSSASTMSRKAVLPPSGGISTEYRMLAEGGVSEKQLTQFTTQLSTLQDAGLPIVSCLKILEGQLRKGFFKNVSPADAERVLHRPVAFTVANDHATMTQAIDRGVPLAVVKRKCALVKDLEALNSGVAAALGLER